MAEMQKKSLSKPDEVRDFPLGRLELVTLNGVTFGRGTFQPGWRWSTSVQPLVKTASCEAPHLQYHVSGRLSVKMDDGNRWNSAPATCPGCRPATMPGSSATNRSSSTT